MTRNIFLIVMILLIASCTSRELTLDINTPPKMYLNGILPAGASQVNFSYGWATPLWKNLPAGSGQNISITVSLNGTAIPMLGDQALIPRKLIAGDKIDVLLHSSDGITATAETVIPPKVDVTSAFGEWKEEGELSSVKVALHFARPISGYFRLSVRSNWLPEDSKRGNRLEDREILALGNSSFWHPRDRVLSPSENPPVALMELANKESLDFEYKDVFINSSSTEPWFTKHIYVAEIEVQRLSEEYYHYLVSYMEANENNSFAAPTNISSNLRGGYGILASYNSSIIKINMQ